MAFNGSTKTFNTIAELKLQSANADVRVNVLGYYAPGDGGGGEFYWDSSSTEADNQGTIIQVTGLTTGRWKRCIPGNKLNVLWFGAKNDYSSSSTTNNAPAINAAMTAAATLRTTGIDSQTQGSVVSVYFPYGKGFRITDTINVSNNVSVIMDGQVVFDNTANDRPAIVIGDSTLTQRKKHVIDVTNKNATNWPAEVDQFSNFDPNNPTRNSIGVKLINQYWCDITIRRAANFAIGVQCFGDPLGFVYNEVRLGILSNNKVNLDLSGANQGWCNENNFYGGRFTSTSTVSNNGKSRYGIRITSSDGTYTNNNNNNFHKPCFELQGSLANPGIALPILIVHGTQNAFYNCRSELNYVASDALIRTFNDSAQNFVEVGFGIDGEVEDLGNFPSTLTSRRGKLLTEKNYISVFDSSDLLRKVCPYDGTNMFASDELFFLNSGDANIYNFITSITLNGDSVQFTSSRGLGVRIDTTSNKSFVVKKSTVSGFGGRTCVRCFNSSGTLLYDTVNPYVKGYPFSIPSANSAFGGHYRMGADASAPLYFNVGSDVAYIDVFVSGGTSPVKLKQLQIQAVDGVAAVISLKKKAGLHAIQSPISGAWSVGDVIYNAVPTTNNIVMWQCTVAGSPGTWVPIYNGNQVTTLTGDVTGSGSTTIVTTLASVGTAGTYTKVTTDDKGRVISGTTLSASDIPSGSGNYIQNHNGSPQTANWRINGIGTVQKDGSASLLSSFLLLNAAGTRGANFQLNADTNPGLNLWMHNGTSWINRMTWDATGNVGIGDTSPDTKLTVEGAIKANNGAVQCTNGTITSFLSFSSGGAVGATGTSSNHPYSLYANSTEYVRILTNGNVGIGVTAPSEKLTVGGSVFVNAPNGEGFLINSSSILRDNSVDLKITTNRVGINTSGTAQSTLHVNGAIFTNTTSAEGVRVINDGGLISFYNTANSIRTGFLNMNTIGGAIFSVELNQPMSLRTNNIERIIIEADGDVGIGTHSPGAKLEVAGQVKITGGSPGLGKVLTSDANGLATWQTPAVNTTYPVVIPPTTANYTALSTDYYIILKPITTGANRTVILPDPTTVTGKTYMIMYDAGASGGTFSWGVSRNIYDAKGGFRVGFNPALGTTLLFFSDGTNWRLLDEWT